MTLLLLSRVDVGEDEKRKGDEDKGKLEKAEAEGGWQKVGRAND